MHCVKLTVLIEDNADLDMEVRVVAADAPAAAACAPVTVLKPRAVPPPRTVDDEYTLGGYAGI